MRVDVLFEPGDRNIHAGQATAAVCARTVQKVDVAGLFDSHCTAGLIGAGVSPRLGEGGGEDGSLFAQASLVNRTLLEVNLSVDDGRRKKVLSAVNDLRLDIEAVVQEELVALAIDAFVVEAIIVGGGTPPSSPPPPSPRLSPSPPSSPSSPPPPPSSPSASKKSGLSAGAIAGIAVGGAVFILGVGGLLVLRLVVM